MRSLPRSPRRIIWIILPIALILLAAWTTLKLRVQPLKRTEMIMGTVVEISVIPADEEAIKEAFDAIKKVDELMSTYKPESEVSILNRQGENHLSPQTTQIIQEAIKFSEMTEGAFDITCRPLINLWKRAKKEAKIPTLQEIEEAKELVSYKKIALEDDLVKFQQPGMQIDLGGIAKGWAVDKAIQALKKRGVRAALVNAGGDLYALGRRGLWKKWELGIQHPRDQEKILTTIEVSDKGVATSGDYRRYFTLEGRRFSHIVDPRTGETVEEVPMSVTVVAPDATTADALATGIFVLGPEEGMKLIESLPGIEGLIVSEGMRMDSSSGWDKFQKQ
ncbi:FAD:protein FMN transferase [Candidatus Aerophobetes bacterium]|uniref:FAD:protein FMN transferase n=1 Tax=Aerophobetes bacterium TaxID=2030807 RepID=A0A523WDJ7_UNCAE|nr:MAG: FAD:protein FMN transferase [Candidatus Aerophobetes bacterium]